MVEKSKKADLSRAPDPRREAAFVLFSAGKTQPEIAKAIGVSVTTVSVWTSKYDWKGRFKKFQKEYEKRMIDSLAGTRVKKDADAIKSLLDVRTDLIRKLQQCVDKIEPTDIAKSMKAAQYVLTQIELMNPKEDEDRREVVGIRFVPAPRVSPEPADE